MLDQRRCTGLPEPRGSAKKGQLKKVLDGKEDICLYLGGARVCPEVCDCDNELNT